MTKGKLLTTWDLSELYSGTDDPGIDLELSAMQKRIKEFREKWYGTDFLSNVNKIFESLIEYDKMIDEFFPMKCEYFSYLGTSLDSSDENFKKLDGKINDITQKAVNDFQFYSIGISKLDSEMQKKILDDERFFKFKHFLEREFQSGKYTLSDAEEKILNMKDSVSHDRWEKLTNEMLAKKEKLILTDQGKEELTPYTAIYANFSSQKQEVRDSGAKALSEIYEESRDTATAEFNALLENKKIDDELRTYELPEQSRMISDDMDTEVVNALIQAVSSKFSIVGRFYKLKAKLLGKEKLKYQDRNVEIGEIEMNLNYEDAAKLVSETFREIDPEFGDIFDGFLTSGMIDVYPKKGKRGGASCAHGSHNIKPYILLNHKDKLDDTLTLAHEAGHGINHYLLNKYNTGVNHGSSTAIAEVASTFFEDSVIEKLSLKFTSPSQILSLKMKQLNDCVNIIFRQISFYQTEQMFHKSFREKFNLSADELAEIFITNVREFAGNEIEIEEGIKNWWIGVPHFRFFFYVYSYSSGLLISKALQNILKSDKKFVDKIKVFLKSGSSKSPYQIFMEMGIDIKNPDFWVKGVDEIEKLLIEAEDLAKELNYKIS